MCVFPSKDNTFTLLKVNPFAIEYFKNEPEIEGEQIVSEHG